MMGGKKRKGKKRGVSNLKKKKKTLALALNGGSVRGDGQVRLRSNKVQNQ